jgi:presenilin-like A22 family membrane protease
VWKAWFFLAVLLALTIAIGAFVPFWYAFALSLALAAWKVFRPNVIIHNVTEVLVYSGIAWLIVPNFSLLTVSLLLVAIAIYDAWAVWRSKHMVAMARFQSDAKLFAGLLVPYGSSRSSSQRSSSQETKRLAKTTVSPSKTLPRISSARTAVLGGGDIAFPLLFSGAVLISLLKQGFALPVAFALSLIVVAAATASLTLLFVFAKKDVFYPAMPFISAGCFVGYGILWLAALA